MTGEKMTIAENSYAFVSKGIVIGTVTIDPEAISYDRKKAGFENTTAVIDITDNEEARIGSTWDGSSFTHDDSVPAYIEEDQHRFAFISNGNVFFIKRIASAAEGTLKSFKDAESEGISVYKVTTESLPEIGNAWN
jgi:hypothetical protein